MCPRFVAEASDVYGNGPTARTYDAGTGSLNQFSVYAVWTPAAAPVPVAMLVGHGVLIVALASGAMITRLRLRGR